MFIWFHCRACMGWMCDFIVCVISLFMWFRRACRAVWDGQGGADQGRPTAGLPPAAARQSPQAPPTAEADESDDG